MFWENLPKKLHHFNHTLRGKLSLWYLASVGLIIIVFVASTAILFWITLQSQIDHHIHITVNEAHDVVQNYRGDERDELLKNLVSAQGMTIIVLSPDGAPVIETNSPDIALVTEHQLQKILINSNLNEPSPVHFTESSIRFAATPVQINAGKGILAVGYSTQVLYSTFNKMLLIVGSIILFLVLPITLVGYKLLKQQLKPLESISHQAQAISGKSTLKKRISISSPTEELITIQQAINSMLSELERVFTNERQFYSDAAHTLKTPLAVLRSQVENSTLTNKIKQKLLGTIDATSETIADLLLLAKVGNKSQSKNPISLSDLMHSLVELTTLLAQDKKVRVESDIENNIAFHADKILLQRALANITQNAVAYNQPKGNICISLKKTPKRIVIEITDTGIGIKKSEQAQLFTRFFRGSNSHKAGSGLGLAITKAIIEDLGGGIQINSELHQGTQVRIYLPS